MSWSGVAAWANLTLNQRVLDLLADILFAVDEINAMVEAEHGLEPFSGFREALRHIYLEAEFVMNRLGDDAFAVTADAMGANDTMTAGKEADDHAWLRLFDEEQQLGRSYAAILLALPTSEWETCLRNHPEWLCAGTLDRLLAEADDVSPTDIMRALSITSFVIAHVRDLPQSSRWHKHIPALEAGALISHGNALVGTGNHLAALQAALRAEALLGIVAVGDIPRADAQLLRARVWADLEKDEQALDLLDECMTTYAEHGEAFRYNDALITRALLLCDMCQWDEAWHTLRQAQEQVTYIENGELRARLEQAVTRCRKRGLPDEATLVVAPFPA
jgi:tetratricopeptide (TPR) repeat protein